MKKTPMAKAKKVRRYENGGMSGTIDRSDDTAARLKAAADRFRASMTPEERAAAFKRDTEKATSKVRTAPAYTARTSQTSLEGRGTTLTPNLMRRTKDEPFPKPTAADRLKAARTSKTVMPDKAPAKAKPAPAKAPAKPAPSAPAKTVSTKGGDYPVYKKDSAEGKSFAAEFAAKRKAGEKEFTWQGRKYSTKKKGE